MGWVSVKDKLPKEGEEVIFTDGEDVVAGYMLDKVYGTWYDWGGNTWTPTHWQPLPDPPKEKGTMNDLR